LIISREPAPLNVSPGLLDVSPDRSPIIQPATPPEKEAAEEQEEMEEEEDKEEQVADAAQEAKLEAAGGAAAVRRPHPLRRSSGSSGSMRDLGSQFLRASAKASAKASADLSVKVLSSASSLSVKMRSSKEALKACYAVRIEPITCRGCCCCLAAGYLAC
jgi:hypothetical protein